MYETNSQAWERISRGYDESIRRTAICQDLFGQDNLKGLTPEQQDLFWASV